MLAGLNIKRDYQANLLFSRVANRGRPGSLLPQNVINSLFVREEDLTVKAFLAGGKIIGAEALVAGTAVDGE